MSSKSGINWQGCPVLVTGGASFIGSHLVDALVLRKAKLRVVDNLSSGNLENLKSHLNKGSIEFIQADLREPGVCPQAVKGMQLIFHLAAEHGGRGYVQLHQAQTANNLFLDGLLFHEALKQGAGKIVFASSGCVYPNYLQNDLCQELYLAEDMVKAPHDADNMYGWAKLMAELTLAAYYREYGLKSVSCRYFTVYGPRGLENHAVMAMIARAFIGQDPFEVWGSGQQIRNWTYVDDIVQGTILAAERIDDAQAINLGTTERIRVIDAAGMVLAQTGHTAKIKLMPQMPTGPLNRVANNSLARQLLGWCPQMLFSEGLKQTIKWYFATKQPDAVKKILDRMLTER